MHLKSYFSQFQKDILQKGICFIRPVIAVTKIYEVQRA